MLYVLVFATSETSHCSVSSLLLRGFDDQSQFNYTYAKLDINTEWLNSNKYSDIIQACTQALDLITIKTVVYLPVNLSLSEYSIKHLASSAGAAITNILTCCIWQSPVQPTLPLHHPMGQMLSSLYFCMSVRSVRLGVRTTCDNFSLVIGLVRLPLASHASIATRS